MSVQKIRGLVLKEIPAGESNKQIVVLAKDSGKVFLSAKGARKSKSKLLAATQVFCYCDFVLFEGKGFASIAQADILESFYEMRKNIETVSYGAYILEVLEKTILPGMESNDILELALRTFFMFCRTEGKERLLTEIFEVKYLQLSGYLADISQCYHCGANMTDGGYLDKKSGEILCLACGAKREKIRVYPGTWKALQYILLSEGSHIFQFTISPEILENLRDVTRIFMAVYINETFASLQFAEKL